MELSPREDLNRRMLRARDEMDRRYAEPLDVPSLAALTHLSTSRFGKVFRDVFGGTFSRTFSAVVGCSPSEFREQSEAVRVPSCFVAAWTRPREAAPQSSRPVDPPTRTTVSEKQPGGPPD